MVWCPFPISGSKGTLPVLATCPRLRVVVVSTANLRDRTVVCIFFFFDPRNVSFLPIPLFSRLSFVLNQLVPSLSDLLSITTYFHPRKLFSTVSEYHDCYPLSLSLSFSHSISSILFASSTPIDLFIHIPANFLLIEKLKERYNAFRSDCKPNF